MRLIKKASHRGYLPAQIVIAENATGKFQKAAWKTVIVAQEIYYKYRIDAPSEIPTLVPEMEDFSLRGLGFAEGVERFINLDRENLVPEESIAEFFDALLAIYEKYVKPFRPVPHEAMQNAIRNVINYDVSDVEGHPQYVRLP